eukprot:scaffold2880_cov173-Amphora_coffeaeformis.AAC.9
MNPAPGPVDHPARHYLEHTGRFTVLHAQDLIQLLREDITVANTTILDVGCGPGVFGLAYLDAFPRGIAGQTVICSDVSPVMVEYAQQVLKERIPSDCLTQFVFQVEDGSELKGITDDSVDVVVSIFGIFLIPDYRQTLNAIRRVLRPNRGVLGIATWTLSQERHALGQEGFGPSFHQIIEETLQELTNLCDKSDSPSINNNNNNEVPWKRWFQPERIRAMVIDDAGYNDSLEIVRSLHSIAWPSADAFWEMIVTSPNTKLGTADPERVGRIKKNLMDALVQARPPSSTTTMRKRPVIVVSASNLILARP